MEELQLIMKTIETVGSDARGLFYVYMAWKVFDSTLLFVLLGGGFWGIYKGYMKKLEDK